MVFIRHLLLLSTLLISACSHLDNWRVYDEFSGVRSVMAASSMDVLIVHGMGHGMDDQPGSSLGYSLKLQAAMVKKLGFHQLEPDRARFHISKNGVLLGSVQRFEYRDAVDHQERRIRFFEVSWAESVKPIKETLLEINSERDYAESSPLQEHRLAGNAIGKRFINTHLADPLIYVGQYGRELRAVIQQAICIMTRADLKEGQPCDFESEEEVAEHIVWITVSQGSTLVFDSLSQLGNGSTGSARRETDDDSAKQIRMKKVNLAKRFAAATSHIYMLANQLPLLELAFLRAPTRLDWLNDYPCPADPSLEKAGAEPVPEVSGGRDAPPMRTTSDQYTGGLGGFLNMRAETLKTQGLENSRLNIVGFSDPNDILTYYFTDDLKAIALRLSSRMWK